MLDIVSLSQNHQVDELCPESTYSLHQSNENCNRWLSELRGIICNIPYHVNSLLHFFHEFHMKQYAGEKLAKQSRTVRYVKNERACFDRSEEHSVAN